jgi:restriction endonuclease S subunit
MKDVDDVAGLKPDGCLRIRGENLNTQRHLLQPGDILIQSRGQKFPAVVVDQPIFGIAALGLYVVRPNSDALPAYLAWFLNQPRTRAALRGVARGTYIPFLSASDLRDLRIPVPAISTQQRIADIEQLRRQERHLADRLRELTDELVDAATWTAAHGK